MKSEVIPQPNAASEETASVVVIVVDRSETRVALELDDWNTVTLLACVSENPADWSELAAAWPRYRTAASAEFAEALPLILSDWESAWSHLGADRPWMMIDLRDKRVFSGRAYDTFAHHRSFGLGPAEGFERPVRLSIHLPPWWEIHNGADPVDVCRRRQSEINIPNPRRDVLWGPPLAQDLAQRMVTAARGKGLAAVDSSRALYQLTVAVHRDWLMTSREDLGGGIPRDCLHGGFRWLDRVIEAQSSRLRRDDGFSPTPCELDSRETAPFGRAEVCLYFDACRELIDIGWRWLFDNSPRISDPACDADLAEVLTQALERWLDEPAEDGLCPVEIIRAERLRIPFVAGQQREGHKGHCDCPICDMAASGAFGPTIVCFDGHHLELDDEFAFSLCETREEWESERGCEPSDTLLDDDINSLNGAGNRYAGEEVDPDAVGEVGIDDRVDAEWMSPWRSSHVTEEPLPGDPRGHLTIAFRLAEMISVLQELGNCQFEIDALNQAFRDFRGVENDASRAQNGSAAAALQQELEAVASRHPELVARSADLQSTLDELLRRKPEETARGSG